MQKISTHNFGAIAGDLLPGPVVLILNEDDFELASTVEHHRDLGFENIVVIGAPNNSAGIDATIVPAAANGSPGDVINPLMDMLAGRWVLVLYNAEYLIFPFCEHRTIRDVTQFMDEERRNAVFCVTVDLYSEEIDRDATNIDRENMWFDKAGYYAMDRFDGPDRLVRQINIFGGLKWRYAEHVPWHRQSIERIALFRAATGLRFDSAGVLSDAEMNTIACPWHNNLTAGIASCRVAKSLLQNPGSTWDIERFTWGQSERFDWTSTQLMHHGLIEPGQWF